MKSGFSDHFQFLDILMHLSHPTPYRCLHHVPIGGMITSSCGYGGQSGKPPQRYPLFQKYN